MNESFDPEFFLSYVVAGDMHLAGQLVDLFFEEYPRLIAALDEAAARGDSRAIVAAAHGVKNLVGNFRASAPFRVAEEIEERFIANPESQIGDSVIRLKAEMSAFREELAAMRRNLP